MGQHNGNQKSFPPIITIILHAQSFFILFFKKSHFGAPKKITTFPPLYFLHYWSITGLYEQAAAKYPQRNKSPPPCFPCFPRDKLAMLFTSRPGSPEGPVRPGGPTGPGGPRSPGPPEAPCLPGSPWKERETNTAKSKSKQILPSGTEVVYFNSHLKSTEKVLASRRLLNPAPLNGKLFMQLFSTHIRARNLSSIIWFKNMILINKSHK